MSFEQRDFADQSIGRQQADFGHQALMTRADFDAISGMRGNLGSNPQAHDMLNGFGLSDAGKSARNIPENMYCDAGDSVRKWFGGDKITDALSGKKDGSDSANYKPMVGADGKPANIKMREHFWQDHPTVRMNIDGKPVDVTMKLPGSDAKSVNLSTDGHHVRATDPKSGDSWTLQRNSLLGYENGYSWSKNEK